jgi:hypothetical protein
MVSFVKDLMVRIRSEIPDAPQEALARIEIGVCRDWGGNHPYVIKNPTAETRIAMVSTGLRQGRPIPECFAQAGVSRATGYRILSRK